MDESGIGRRAISREGAWYWDAVCADWRGRSLWRAHSDAVNTSLFADWLPDTPVGRLLKTDLFDEVCGEGLYPLLATRAEQLVAVDVSCLAVGSVLAGRPGLLAVPADVRQLPFADGVFDAVVSNSTLDHFRTSGDVVLSLRELCRVLREGGHLLLTLDNLANPMVALRNALPFRPLKRLRIVPYYVGSTYRPAPLRAVLRETGFDVLEMKAVMHCPRVLSVGLAGMLERWAGADAQRGFLRMAMAFERLSRTPLRFLTGYFIAVRAVKADV